MIPSQNLKYLSIQSILIFAVWLVLIKALRPKHCFDQNIEFSPSKSGRVRIKFGFLFGELWVTVAFSQPRQNRPHVLNGRHTWMSREGLSGVQAADCGCRFYLPPWRLGEHYVTANKGSGLGTEQPEFWSPPHHSLTAWTTSSLVLWNSNSLSISRVTTLPRHSRSENTEKEQMCRLYLMLAGPWTPKYIHRFLCFLSPPLLLKTVQMAMEMWALKSPNNNN